MTGEFGVLVVIIIIIIFGNSLIVIVLRANTQTQVANPFRILAAGVNEAYS